MKPEIMTPSGMNFISHNTDGDMLAQQYESTFTDLAYQAFQTKYPQMAPMVTTFQVIVSDIDEGSAVGAFILDLGGQIYHVPVAMMDNKIKPMDMIYSKEMDKFFPFTDEWIDVVESAALQEEGEAVNHKDLGVQAPYDVTTMLQPPTAAYRGGLGLSPTGMSKMPGMNTVASYEDIPPFTDFLKVASNETKEKFLEMLEGNPTILKFAAEKFGIEPMQKALQKTAEEQNVNASVENDELRVLDIDSPVEEIKKVFQGSAVKAMEELARRGFTAKDSRKGLSSVYDTESPVKIEQVEKSGFYSICKQDGTMVPALVLCNLIPRRGPHTDYDYYDYSYGDDTPCEAIGSKRKRRDKLVIFEDGSHFRTTSKIAAHPCTLTPEVQTKFSKLMEAKRPKQKDALIFIKKHKDTFIASEPMYIEKVIMEPSGAVRYTELDPYIDDNYKPSKNYHSNEIGTEPHYRNNQQITILPSLPTAAKPFYSDDRNTLYLEKGFLPFVLGELADIHDFLLGPSSVLNHLRNRAYLNKARDVKISSRGGDDYSVNGRPVGSARETTEKVAREYNAPFEIIYEKVANLKNRGDKTELLIVPFEKDASIFMGTSGSQVSPEMVQEDMQEQQAMQAQQQAQQMPMGPMDPSMMQAGAGMMNPEIFNLGAIQNIVQDPKVIEMMQEYTPALEKAMDHSARLLLTLYTEGGQHKEDLGEDRFKELEGSARNAFKELGNLLLLVVRHPGEIV